MSPKLEKFLRYTGVNATATVVDYVVFLTLTDIFGIPIVQSAVAYGIASIVNYLMSKRYVFVHDMSHKSEHRLFIEFVGSSLLGLVLTAVIVWVTVHMMRLPPFDGKTISVLICFAVLYVVRNRLVFTENPKADSSYAA